MASGEAPQASIGGFLPSSSQGPSDLIRESIPPVKNAWSEIVRGASHAARSRAVSPPKDSQPTLLHHSSSPNTRVAGTPVPVKFQELDAGSSSVSLDGIAGFIDASPVLSSDDINSPQSQVACDTVPETPAASPDGLAKHAHPSPAKSPKPAWGKPATKAGESLEPEPVMGAIAWPALSETRNTKSFEPSKSGTQRSPLKQASPSLGDEPYVEAPPSLKEELGTNRGVLSSHKSFNLHQTARNGNILRDSTSSNAVFPVKVMHAEDSGQSRRSGSRENKLGPVVDSTASNPRNAASLMSRSTPGNNVLRDHGRGNQGWPPHGRGYANSIHGYANSMDNAVLPQHQWATHKNLQQPLFHFFNPNPGFVHAAGFPNVPGSMYYISTPPPEPFLGATYFVPPVPGVSQGVVPPSLDRITLKRMLLNQIEYYFSVENLCRDIYLRSNMDEQGFVPISLIGNFNRVKGITQNPLFIVEALQTSSVVEVQGDKVRKRVDWATWLLPSSQLGTGMGDSPMDESLRKTEIRQAQFGKVENQSNGVGYLRTSVQAEEKPTGDGRSADCREDDKVESKNS